MKNSGIYIIKNIINDNFYLGSSNNFNKRKSEHIRKLRKNKHHSIYLQRAWNKYTESNFIFEIFFYCELTSARFFEQYFLDLLNPVYNMAKNATAPMQGRKHKPETIIKFKSKIQPKGKDSCCFGKKTPDDVKQKQRLKKLGSRRSEETKNKMSNTAKRVNSISRIDREKTKKKIEDCAGNTFNSLIDAAKFWNVAVSTICDNLKGRSFALKNGVQFRYLRENKDWNTNKKIIQERGKGQRASKSKLTNEEVIEIRKLRKFGIGPSALSKKFNINRSNIQKICKGETWKHIPLL